MSKGRFIFTSMFLLFSAYLCFSAITARAQVSFSNDKSQFLADNPKLVLQNFENGNVPAPTTFIFCSPPEDSKSDDACFLPGDILRGIAFNQTPFSPDGILLLGENSLGTGNNPPAVLMNNTYLASFEVDLAPGGNAIGMDIGCVRMESACADTVVVQVFGVSGLLGSTVVPVTSDFDTFLGISSTQQIKKILITDNDVSTLDIRGVLNVWFEYANRRIPALSEWGMIASALGLGFVGVFFARKRRKAQGV